MEKNIKLIEIIGNNYIFAKISVKSELNCELNSDLKKVDWGNENAKHI